MNRKIELFSSKDNYYGLRINNKFIYSKFYPMRDAEKFIENNQNLYLDKKYIVMYGLGFGYHLKHLLTRMSSDSKIFLFDLDMEINNIANKYHLLDEVKNDKRVKIILGNNANFYNEFSNKLDLVDDIIIYQPLIDVLDDKYNNFKEIIKSYKISKLSLSRFKPVMDENERINVENHYDTIGHFLKKFNFQNKSIVIASAGPSLEKDLDIIEKIRDNIKIFAVGRALDILMKHGIKPDMFTILDPSKAVYNQIKGYENLDVPLCFLYTGSRWAIGAYNGPKYIFFNKECEYNKENIIICTGKTVAIPTIDLAVKTGAKKIILCGQDLAFVDNKFHAGDIENIKEDNMYKKVEGVDGYCLRTTSGMLEFKKGIERLIENNPNVTFINCSKGAKIKGTIEMKLDDLISPLY